LKLLSNNSELEIYSIIFHPVISYEFLKSDFSFFKCSGRFLEFMLCDFINENSQTSGVSVSINYKIITIENGNVNFINCSFKNFIFLPKHDSLFNSESRVFDVVINVTRVFFLSFCHFFNITNYVVKDGGAMLIQQKQTSMFICTDSIFEKCEISSPVYSRGGALFLDVSEGNANTLIYPNTKFINCFSNRGEGLFVVLPSFDEIIKFSYSLIDSKTFYNNYTFAEYEDCVTISCCNSSFIDDETGVVPLAAIIMKSVFRYHIYQPPKVIDPLLSTSIGKDLEYCGLYYYPCASINYVLEIHNGCPSSFPTCFKNIIIHNNYYLTEQVDLSRWNVVGLLFPEEFDWNNKTALSLSSFSFARDGNEAIITDYCSKKGLFYFLDSGSLQYLSFFLSNFNVGDLYFICCEGCADSIIRFRGCYFSYSFPTEPLKSGLFAIYSGIVEIVDVKINIDSSSIPVIYSNLREVSLKSILIDSCVFLDFNGKGQIIALYENSDSGSECLTYTCGGVSPQESASSIPFRVNNCSFSNISNLNSYF
jgi:hypothetical protein